MGYGLAYLAVICFYSYLKYNEPQSEPPKSRKNQEKRRYQAPPVRNLTKRKMAKRNSLKDEQSYLDSSAHQQKRMGYH